MSDERNQMSADQLAQYQIQLNKARKNMTIEELRQAEEEFNTIINLFREAGGLEKK
jgi:hypothetical protein